MKLFASPMAQAGTTNEGAAVTAIIDSLHNPLGRIARLCAGLLAALLLLSSVPSEAAKKVKAKKPVPPPAWQQVTLSKAIKVLVYDSDGKLQRQASGALTAEREVVTVCHPLRDAAKIAIESNGNTLPAALKHADRAHDLCLLQVDALEASALPIASARKLKSGAAVYALAFDGDSAKFTAGKIKALRPLDESLYIEPDFNVSARMSGGALLNAKGELIGILMAYLPEDGINFAAPSDWIREIPARSFGDTRFVMNEGSRLSWLNKSIALEQKREWAELSRWAQRWTRAEPNDRWAWFTLANAQSHRQQYADAVKSYQRGLRIKPDYAIAWNNLGTAYAYLEQPDKAIAAHEIATRLAPDSESGWFNLGLAYESAQRYDEALYAYSMLTKLKPDSAAGWFNAGRARLRLGQNALAEEAFRKALELEPGHARALYNLGIVYINTGERTKLADVIEKLTPLDAEKAAALRR